jgi:hypothetical protein
MEGTGMDSDLARERRQAHAYLDRLPENQVSAVRGLLESMLSSLDRKLALAPMDDEPLTPEEAAAVLAGAASLDRDGGVPMEQILADLGLSMDDFRRMAEAPPQEEPHRNA